MYNDDKYTELFHKIIHDFKKRLETKGRKLILLVIPQLYDIKNAIKEKTSYQLFFEKMKSEINVIDLTNSLKDLSNYKHYYLEDKHGGHFSADGNRLVSEIILNDIKKMIR